MNSIDTELTQLVLKHLEREVPNGSRILNRSKVGKIVSLVSACMLMVTLSYFIIRALPTTHPGWLPILIIYAALLLGCTLTTRIVDAALPVSGNADRQLETNLNEVPASIALDIRQAFRDHNPSHVRTNFIALWARHAFYASASDGFSQVFHPSHYAYLLVRRVSDVLFKYSKPSQPWQMDATAVVGTTSDSPSALKTRPITEAAPNSVACRHCGHFHSPKATNCPICGEPTSQGFFHVNRLTGERRSKAEKLTSILVRFITATSMVCLPIDVILFGGEHFMPIFFFFVASIGFGLFLQVGHWWHHE